MQTDDKLQTHDTKKHHNEKDQNKCNKNKELCFRKGCKYNRKEYGEMIQCIHCFEKYHYSCTEDDAEELESCYMYSCPNCRRSFSQVYQNMMYLEEIVEQVKPLSELQTTIESLNYKLKQVTGELQKVKQKLALIESPNGNVKHNPDKESKTTIETAEENIVGKANKQPQAKAQVPINDKHSNDRCTAPDKGKAKKCDPKYVNSENNRCGHNTSHSVPRQRKAEQTSQKTSYAEKVKSNKQKSSVIIGDFTVQHLEVDKPDRCRYMNKATISDIKNELTSLTEENKSFHNVTLIVGSNDCDTDKPVKEMKPLSVWLKQKVIKYVVCVHELTANM